MLPNIKAYCDNSHYNNEFVKLSTSISNYAKKAGARVIPFTNPSLPHFSTLPTSTQKLILSVLSAKVGWLESAEAAGVAFDSNQQILWHAVKSMDLVLCSDLMDKITDQHIIEIHWLETLVQAFHSFSFYEKSSYTLEEICSYSWQELYKVDLATQEGIFNLAQSILNGTIKKTFSPNFPSYIVSELLSTDRLDVKIDYHYVSPLFNKQGQPVAAISVESLKVLSVDKQVHLPNQRELTPTL